MLIKSLQLLSDDLPGTAKFYGEVLGLKILSQSGEELRLAAGETVLSFHRSHQQKPQYHFAFNIPCNKTWEALQWLKGKTPLLDVEPGEPIADFKNWNATAFYFLDNNENIMEFIARNDLHNETPSTFDGMSILSVSEIGIVGDDVPAQSKDLIDRYGVDYFAKQPPLPRFAALGDDQGLFIVVPHSRDWYPTTIPSAKHWLRAEIVVNGREHVVEQYARP
jgi:catechol 2,3-dioxygenase-like lactoylglutathione lyase family enzyme